MKLCFCPGRFLIKRQKPFLVRSFKETVQNFQVLSSETPHSSFFRTKTRLNDVFAVDLALRNGEYKERSGNQAFNGLLANVMN